MHAYNTLHYRGHSDIRTLPRAGTKVRARAAIDRRHATAWERRGDEDDAIETRTRAGVDAVGGVFVDVRARGGGARGDDGGGTDRPLRGE